MNRNLQRFASEESIFLLYFWWTEICRGLPQRKVYFCLTSDQCQSIGYLIWLAGPSQGQTDIHWEMQTMSISKSLWSDTTCQKNSTLFYLYNYVVSCLGLYLCVVTPVVCYCFDNNCTQKKKDHIKSECE